MCLKADLLDQVATLCLICIIITVIYNHYGNLKNPVMNQDKIKSSHFILFVDNNC